MMKRGGAPGLSVRLVVIFGTLLSVSICAVLIFLGLRPDRNYLDSPSASSGDSFHRLLREYDSICGSPPDPGQLDTLSALLDKVERSARGVESWLSLLKRRRALAGVSPRMLLHYQDSGRRAAAAFPWSEPLAAVAAAALLQGSPVTAESAGMLRDYTAHINETRLCPLALGVAILAGDFNSPALALDRGEALLSAGLPLIRPGMAKESGDRLIADLVILRLLKGDYRGAEAQLLGISRPEIPELRNFLGEYYYDFGNPLQAAEIFSRAADEKSLLRSADALWLGRRPENARNIWLTLSRPGGAVPSESEIRSIYNLAATAPSPEERDTWLNLINTRGPPALTGEPSYQYGLAAYTRTLALYEALALLDEPGPAFMDLEILRRRAELWTVDRTVAETWMLLGRHPQDSRLYQWAVWYFAYQHRYEEAAMLIKTAGYRNIRGPWLDLAAALRYMETGSLDQAEELLRTPDPENRRLWQADANLGLILESRHAPFPALECYETATGRVEDKQAASRLQLHIAGCLRSLGRVEDSRRALHYSLDLNPDNLAARLELRRLEGR
ncbi:MAG: tetratricopeptide repeat protein [Treponema sp.]|jgi:tetratricopeptide (TPR) repeat protein|nr:tetratricopeptide repeat protein [Treponema sp.]